MLLLLCTFPPLNRAAEGQASFLYLDGAISLSIFEKGHYLLGLFNKCAHFLVQDSFRYDELFFRRSPAESLCGGLVPVYATARESSVFLVLVSEEQVALRRVNSTVPHDVPHNLLKVGQFFLKCRFDDGISIVFVSLL